MKKLIAFNINDSVLVKLTDKGREIHRNWHEELRRQVPTYKGTYLPPKEDENGYSRFQLWSLMNYFGPFCSLGLEVPFDTEILFEVREQPETPSAP